MESTQDHQKTLLVMGTQDKNGSNNSLYLKDDDEKPVAEIVDDSDEYCNEEDLDPGDSTDDDDDDDDDDDKGYERKQENEKINPFDKHITMRDCKQIAVVADGKIKNLQYSDEESDDDSDDDDTIIRARKRKAVTHGVSRHIKVARKRAPPANPSGAPKRVEKKSSRARRIRNSRYREKKEGDDELVDDDHEVDESAYSDVARKRFKNKTRGLKLQKPTRLNQEIWMEHYERLKEFIAKNGHGRFPRSNENDLEMSKWVNNQVRMGPLNKIAPVTKKRFYLMEDIGFWDLSIYEHNIWMVNFRRAKRHKERTNHFRFTDKIIYAWSRRQLQHINNVDLAGERRKLLDSIDFFNLPLHKAVESTWDDDAWKSGFERIKQFFAEHGHFDVKDNHAGGDNTLFVWVRDQRRALLKKSPLLTKEYYDLLNEIGFWDPKLSYKQYPTIDETKWMPYFERLKEYKAKHGHCHVMHAHQDLELYSWVNSQREFKRKKNGFLSEKYIKLLDSIGFWDTPPPKDPMRDPAAWMANFEAVKALYTEHGHFRLKKINKRLFRWLENEKQLRRRSSKRQTKEQFKLMKDLGVPFTK